MVNGETIQKLTKVVSAATWCPPKKPQTSLLERYLGDDAPERRRRLFSPVAEEITITDDSPEEKEVNSEKNDDALAHYVSVTVQLRAEIEALKEELQEAKQVNVEQGLSLRSITVTQTLAIAARNVIAIVQGYAPGTEENYKPPMSVEDHRIMKLERPWIDIEVLNLALEELHKAGCSLAALCGHSTERVSSPIVSTITEDASIVNARYKISLDMHWDKVFQMAGYKNCKTEREFDAYASFVADLIIRMTLVKDIGASSPILGWPPKIGYEDIRSPYPFLCYAERKTDENDPMMWAYLPKVGLVPSIGARESKAYLLVHPFNLGAPLPPTPLSENPAVCVFKKLQSPSQYVLACFRSTRGSAAALIVMLTCLGLGIGVDSQVKKEEDVGAKASFRNLGELSISAQNGHIYGTVDVNGAVLAHNGLVKDLDDLQIELLKKTGEARFRMFINRTVCSAHRTLRAIRDDLIFACEISKCYEEIKRTERCEEPELTVKYDPNWWRAGNSITGSARFERQAAIAAVGAIGLSLFNLVDTIALRADLIEQGGRINQISAKLYQAELNTFENSRQIQDMRKQFELLQNYTSEADARQKGLFLLETTHSYIENTREFCTGLVGMLMRQEIHPRFFDYEHISQALNLVTRKAAEVGLIPIFKKVAGIITEKMSYVAEEGKVVFMIHVSMRHESQFQVYEYIPTPFTLQGNKSVIPKVEKSVLAVKDEMNEFLVLSKTELKECPKMHGTYLCGHMVTRKNLQHSCLGALFKAHTQFAAHHCEFEKHSDAQEFVTQISEQKILVIVPNGHSVTGFVSCEEKTSQQQMVILKGRTIISLELGCVLTTPAHIFRSVQHREIAGGFVMRPLDDMSLEVDKLQIWSDHPYKNVLSPTFSPHLMPKEIPQLSKGSGEWSKYLLVGSIIINVILLTSLSVIYLPRLRINPRADHPLGGPNRQLALLNTSHRQPGATGDSHAADIVAKRHGESRRESCETAERRRSSSCTIKGSASRSSKNKSLERSLSPEPEAGGDGVVIAISSLSLPNRIDDREG